MLTVYGVPLSQPCRAVIWALLIKKQPFKLELINPGSKNATGSRSEAFLAKNPTGTIPMIEDDGFVLWESNAILTYLAQKYGWNDLYPADNLQQRSRIDQYLHWHHRNAREASVRLVATRFRKDIKFPEGHLEQGIATITNAVKVMENSWLARGSFIAGDSLSLADLACYMEFGQLNARFGNLFDFGPYPHVQQWMQRMEALPFFEEANKANAILGDLNTPPTMQNMGRANKESTAAIQAALSKL
eukprot:gnl/TRDRNA2_/TRDRNA2_148181_c0_seq1.p1 gnl/TRDRNA2_/TRDRNA2_148181_c0~~gnl/TRDRNA2_/TRDRNA2_148181_c0_seq1.p1  ORF type:complete len:245 (-),score=46.52 gnl/TRDRNA2_/TRDRNA2_148181_c0_seq1:2-736(-)